MSNGTDWKGFFNTLVAFFTKQREAQAMAEGEWARTPKEYMAPTATPTPTPTLATQSIRDTLSSPANYLRYLNRYSTYPVDEEAGAKGGLGGDERENVREMLRTVLGREPTEQEVDVVMLTGSLSGLDGGAGAAGRVQFPSEEALDRARSWEIYNTAQQRQQENEMTYRIQQAKNRMQALQSKLEAMTALAPLMVSTTPEGYIQGYGPGGMSERWGAGPQKPAYVNTEDVTRQLTQAGQIEPIDWRNLGG